MSRAVALPIRNNTLTIVNGDLATITRQLADVPNVASIEAYEYTYIRGGDSRGVHVTIDHDVITTAQRVREATQSTLPKPIADALVKRAESDLSPVSTSLEQNHVIAQERKKQTFSGALNAIGNEALQQSGAGWYAWRWWASAELHIFHDTGYPYFGGNDGGAHDLFGPFASEADARECGVVMGTASRPLIRSQQLPLLMLPAPKANVIRIPDGAYGVEYVAEVIEAERLAAEYEAEHLADRAARIVSEAWVMQDVVCGISAAVETQPDEVAAAYRKQLARECVRFWRTAS